MMMMVGYKSESTSAMAEEKLMSEYFESLDPPTKTRYKEKIAVINGEDPYLIPDEEVDTDVESLPAVTRLQSFYSRGHEGLQKLGSLQPSDRRLGS